MDEFSRFSVNDAKFNRLTRDGRSCIRKETRLHRTLQSRWLSVFRLILQYAEDLRMAEVPIPEIVEASAVAEGIHFICEDRGPNIVQCLKSTEPEALLEETAVLDQTLEILKKAQKAGAYFDPHIKNFVVSDGKVYYVDFTPPWIGGYFDLRLSMASPAEREILTPFFECMNPKMLGYHFAADLIKMDPAYLRMLPTLHAKLAGKGLLQENDFDIFLKKAENIRLTELRREHEGVFLL